LDLKEKLLGQQNQFRKKLLARKTEKNISGLSEESDITRNNGSSFLKQRMAIKLLFTNNLQ